MNNKTVRDAMAEAERFIKRAKRVVGDSTENEYIYFGTADTGALRRSSLDLTRSLAEMRKP